MRQVPIFYSIRNNELKLFADNVCAYVDQKLEGNELTPKLGSFTLVVEGSTVYIDEVMTREEYIQELKEREQTIDIIKAIEELRR